MQNFLKELYKNLYHEDLVQIIEKDCLVTPVSPKTAPERLYDLAMTFYNIDPTPKDEQPDEYACVHSLTTIVKNMLPDFPVMTYTPTFLEYIKGDKRFKPTTEFKTGNILISPTETGNGSIVGHTGIIGKEGKILSNSSATGLWTDKYDSVSWIERYSRKGGLSIHLFEIIN